MCIRDRRESFNTYDLPADMYFVLDPITTAGSLMVSPVTTLYHFYNSEFSLEFSQFKTSLDIDQNFMIRFDDHSGLSTSVEQHVGKVSWQIAITVLALSDVLAENGVTKEMVYKSLAYVLSQRSDSSEKSLGDTESMVTLMNDLIDRDGVTAWSAEQQRGIVAILSSSLQEVTFVPQGSLAATDLGGEFWNMLAGSEVPENLIPALHSIVSDPTNESLIQDYLDRAYFKIMAGPPPSFVSIEDYLDETTYEVSANGASNYTVDGVNADSTSMVIYARVGDKIIFNPSSNSVFTNHPFEISTVQNDTAGSNNIGSDEGWDQSTFTLTVGSSTPSTLYPHCGVHSGMYTNGSIQIVNEFNINDIDVTGETSNLQVKGTVSTGPYTGASGYTFNVTLASQEDDDHEHTFLEYPGITFYMSNDQGYHGASNPESDVTIFKPKSHFQDEETGGIGGY